MVWIEGGHQIDTVDLYKGKIILTKPITHFEKGTFRLSTLFHAFIFYTNFLLLYTMILDIY